MKPYNNPASGIDGYDDGINWIHVHYKNGKTYEYRSPPLATYHIATMKQLANSQDGLGTYINKNRDVYDAGRLVT